MDLVSCILVLPIMLPYFYSPNFPDTANEVLLDEENSKHIIQVLRMRLGEQLHLTDGNGNLLLCSIVDDNKKHCRVKIESKTFKQAFSPRVFIGISLLKNTNRFEWFLEKATEIGVAGIIPLICERTEKEKFREDRLRGILVSAMLQSQQCWLPGLDQPLSFTDAIKRGKGSRKFIAHCETGKPRNELSKYQPGEDSLILVGPEGDFTPDEIEGALENNFIPVSLGNTRLRTETAGMVAATLLLI